MTKKKLFKRIFLSTLGVAAVCGAVSISILTSQCFDAYHQFTNYNAQMLEYEKDPDKKYEKKGTTEYEQYQAIKLKNIEANNAYNSAVTPLPYLGALTFLSVGILVFQGVNTLAHSNIRSREN